MYKIEDIIAFLKDEISNKIEINCNSDLENDIRITGDDVVELMDKYAIKFNVNMETYLWYFHHEEETIGWFGPLFFNTPRQYVSHIPITPKLLLDSANAGCWIVQYPEHQIPKSRYDVILNRLFTLVLLIILIAIIVKKWSMK